MRLIASSLILAFCGLVYELVLAQTMSVLLGNSYLQYGLTIGLFMAGLGAGAYCGEGFKEPRSRLLRLQSTLCVVAPLGFLTLWLAALWLPAFLLWPMSCALITTIGFITGQELPLLMHLAGEAGRFPVLSADYFGMLLASVAFPYFILPRLGLLGGLCTAALLNALSIQLLIDGKALRQRLIFTGFPAALTFLLLCEEFIWQWFSHRYTSGLL